MMRTGRDGYACTHAMREKAGSAAAPAARYRNCLRGSFIFEPPSQFTSFDHLVGEQLQRGGHLEAERPGGLQVDDKLEFGRPNDRQVGGLRVLENSTRVDTDVTPRIQSIGPIAHQQARFDHLTAETTRRYPIARRERRKLNASAVEEPIAGNEESIGSVAHEGGERRLNF